MLKLSRSRLLRAATVVAVTAAVVVPLGFPVAANAWWVRGGWGWRPGVVIGVPPVYVAPPPVVYAPPPYYGPPPTYYAPPPRAVWFPGRWINGSFIPGHWG